MTGASEGIGRGYALEVRRVLYCSCVLCIISFPSLAGETGTECGHYESFQGKTQ